MPAGIKDAFRSPFHSSNPSSQFYDVDSFTRSSSTQSIRNEYYQANTPQNVGDFNTNYQVRGPDNGKMPNYTPPAKYPTLHPTADYQLANMTNYRPPTEDNVRDPHNGAGWIQPKESAYLRENQLDEQLPRPPSDCDDLINKVLTNRYCRRILRKILLADEDDEDTEGNERKTKTKKKLPPFKKIIEGFSASAFTFDVETIKNIVIYGLIGLLLLCILDLIFKIGQLVKK
jgi:hypothetical protein